MKGFLFSQKRGVGFQRVSEYDPSNREAASLHLCHILLIHWIFFFASLAKQVAEKATFQS